MDAERVTDSLCYHGEGPCWSASWGGLRWVDMLSGDMLSLSALGAQPHRITTPFGVVACVRPRRGGGAVLGIDRGFGLEQPDGTFTSLPPLWEDEVRMNEGSVLPDGSFWCGSMAYDQSPGAAALWRLDADHRAQRMIGDLTVSNGLVCSPDRSRVYYTDTPTGRVDVFDWDPDRGGLCERRTFAGLGDQDGHPDGLTVDAEGHVWAAMNGAGTVLGLDEQGAVSERIAVGARQVTACTFGGEDLATLFITTSRENLEPGDDPAAGSLFAAHPGVRGVAGELEYVG